MPANDDLEVIRELLTGEPPSQGVSEYVKGRLTAVIIAAESHPSTGLVARPRGRRLALRCLAGAAAALAAGAVALTVAGVPGARDNGDGVAVPAAFVVKHVDSALIAAGPAAIANMMVTTRGAAIPGGTTTAEEWSYGDQWRSVTNSPAGQPVYDEGVSTSSLNTLVSFQSRTWARQYELVGRRAATASGSRGCEPVVAAAPALFQSGLAGIDFAASSQLASVARSLATAVSCGTLAAAGRQRVDGVEAIELTSRPSSLISETIWVSPGTYLPVRVVVRSVPGTTVLQQTADITWLPPTARNLAELTVPIPAGFRYVPFAKAVGQTLLQIPGNPEQGAGPAATAPSTPSGSAPTH
jgi:hypothetical protein